MGHLECLCMLVSSTPSIQAFLPQESDLRFKSLFLKKDISRIKHISADSAWRREGGLFCENLIFLKRDLYRHFGYAHIFVRMQNACPERGKDRNGKCPQLNHFLRYLPLAPIWIELLQSNKKSIFLCISCPNSLVLEYKKKERKCCVSVSVSSQGIYYLHSIGTETRSKQFTVILYIKPNIALIGWAGYNYENK